MNNFFLLNEAIELSNFKAFKSGMNELVSIEREADDVFLKHHSIYNLNVINSLYSTFGQEEQVISMFIEQMKINDNYLNTDEAFDKEFDKMDNAFLGVVFSGLGINNDKQIINDETFHFFKSKTLWNVSFRNFWSKRNRLFPKLILCGEIENQISRIGDSGYFKQIIDRLKELDEAVGSWITGDFSYKDVNKTTSLRISPESIQTMSNHGGERLFRLPNGKREYFELHIKTGDLRFHFLPDSANRKVYVGYIGPHLTTISN